MLKNFVLELSSAPGTTTTINLAGAVTDRVAFASVFGTGASCFYFMDDGTQAEWGVGVFTSGSPNTLSRNTVIGNTAGTTARLNFTGSTRVFNEVPGEKLLFVDATGNINTTGNVALFTSQALSVGGLLSAGGGILLPNQVGISMRDAGGTSRLHSYVGSDNYTNQLIAGGTLWRILNQAATVQLFACDSSGNTSTPGQMQANTGFAVPNAVGLYSKDTGGTVRTLIYLSSANTTDTFNAGGVAWRILNQAGTVALFTCDNAGNCGVGGALGVTGLVTSGGLTTSAISATSIAGTSLNVGTGGITGGAISGTSLGAGTGAISGGNLTLSGSATFLNDGNFAIFNSAGFHTLNWAPSQFFQFQPGVGFIYSTTGSHNFTGVVSMGSTLGVAGAISGASLNVGGGTITCTGVTGGPTYKESNGHTWFLSYAGGVMAMTVDATSLGAIQFASDYRLKHSIADAPSGALEAVCSLRPVTYRYRDIGVFHDDGQERHGFIAHELQAVLPSAVVREKDAVDENGEMLSQLLEPMPLIALLTKALQEATARIAALEARLDARAI